MERQTIEQRLEAVVRNNRPTIALTFPLVGVVLLIGGHENVIPAWLAFNPYLIVLAASIMALPLIAGLAPLIDRRAALGLALLALFAWGIELVGVNTGFPYEDFSYQLHLGPMLFGDVPLALPVFYFPILIDGYLLAVLALGDVTDRISFRYPAVIGAVVGLDLILDPGAVALNFWGWTDPGAYYGIPAMNFVGWVLSGSVAVALLHASLDHDALVDRLGQCEFFLDDLINFVLFWGLVNLYFGQLGPALLAGAVLLGLFRAEWFDFAGLSGRQAVEK